MVLLYLRLHSTSEFTNLSSFGNLKAASGLFVLFFYFFLIMKFILDKFIDIFVHEKKNKKMYLYFRTLRKR